MKRRIDVFGVFLTWVEKKGKKNLQASPAKYRAIFLVNVILGYVLVV